MDAWEFGQRLSAFLRLVEQVVPDAHAAAHHLGFPAGSGTLVGSEVGRRLWLSSEARDLVSYLFEDPILADWLRPPPDIKFWDLLFFLASVVDRSGFSGETIDEFAVGHAEEILEALFNPTIVGTTILISYGLDVREQIELPYGLGVAPATPEALQRLMEDVPTDLLRMPRKPTSLLMASVSADRSELGPLAGSWGAVVSYPMVEELRHAVWLATGVRLGKGHTLSYQNSQYPFFPLMRIPPRPEEQMVVRCDPAETRSMDPQVLWEITARTVSVSGVGERVADDETAESLWTVLLYVHPALGSADARMTTLLSYAAMEGLLLRSEDDDSRLGPRMSWLLGRTDPERRKVRRLVQRLIPIRGAFAHGDVLDLDAVSELVDRDLRQADPWRVRNEIQDELRTISLGLLRRTLMAFLWLALETTGPPEGSSAPVLQAVLTRGEIIDTLEGAAGGDVGARALLDERIPMLARIWQ